jgi:hypothetical protein
LIPGEDEEDTQASWMLVCPSPIQKGAILNIPKQTPKRSIVERGGVAELEDAQRNCAALHFQ